MCKEQIEITKVYVSDTSCLLDEKLFQKYYQEAPLFRREKVDRMKMQEDKIRGLAAGVLLQKAYLDFCEELAASSLYIKEDNASLHKMEESEALPEVFIGKNGKPYFVDSDIYFNLSHSGRRVLCALSTSEVGCDVEYKNKNSDKIANRFFANEEADYINSSIEEKDLRFTRIWTLKESLLKACGCGISYPMNEFSVVEGNHLCEKITFTGDGLDYYLINYPSENGYSFSCASRSGNFSDIRNISL